MHTHSALLTPAFRRNGEGTDFTGVDGGGYLPWLRGTYPGLGGGGYLPVGDMTAFLLPYNILPTEYHKNDGMNDVCRVSTTSGNQGKLEGIFPVREKSGNLAIFSKIREKSGNFDHSIFFWLI